MTAAAKRYGSVAISTSIRNDDSTSYCVCVSTECICCKLLNHEQPNLMKIIYNATVLYLLKEADGKKRVETFEAICLQVCWQGRCQVSIRR